jgi:hypothetical protein
MPIRKGRPVRPLQVVDDEDDRARSAQLPDQRQDLLRRRRDRIRPAQRHLTPQQPRDRLAALPAAHPTQRVEQRQQRQRLAELVARAPQHRTPPGGPDTRRGDQRRLADPRLAVDQHRAAPARTHLRYQPGQPGQLGMPADERR